MAERSRKHDSLIYLSGYAVALVLTLIPFGAVAFGWFSFTVTIWLIAVCAVAQVVTHLIAFLHLDRSSQLEDLLLVLFTLLIIGMVLGGGLWVIFDLNARMATGVPG